MDIKKFLEQIKFEELAKINDSTKFMLKAYLLVKLRSGQTEPCFIYSVGRITDCCLYKTPENLRLALNLEKQYKNRQMENYFEEMSTKKQWDISSSSTRYYWGDKEVSRDDCGNLPKFDKEVETTEKTTYYFKSRTDIQPLPNNFRSRKFREGR